MRILLGQTDEQIKEHRTINNATFDLLLQTKIYISILSFKIKALIFYLFILEKTKKQVWFVFGAFTEKLGA